MNQMTALSDSIGGIANKLNFEDILLLALIFILGSDGQCEQALLLVLIFIFIADIDHIFSND